MGIRPAPNYNIAGECDCRSVFDINVPDAEFTVQGVTATGTLKLKGNVCPNCENQYSKITLFSFVDDDPTTDGNQSFTFKALAINPPECFPVEDGLELFIEGIGIYKTATGEKHACSFALDFVETFTGDDMAGAISATFSLTFAEGFLNNVPDNQLTIYPCSE